MQIMHHDTVIAFIMFLINRIQLKRVHGLPSLLGDQRGALFATLSRRMDLVDLVIHSKGSH